MTLDSETTVYKGSGGSFDSDFVDLSFSSYSDPETYDPTDSGTQGNKRMRDLLGVAVLGADDDVDVTYDEANRQFRLTSKDGTGFTGSVTLRVRVDGNRGP